MASTPACADSTCGARTPQLQPAPTVLAVRGLLAPLWPAMGARARQRGAGGAAGMGMDQAATRGHGLDRPAGGPSLLSARHRCPLAAKVLPVSSSVGTRMVHTANFAGIGKGRRPQATCQREECEPFGVIPNYVINYLIVLIFINRLPFPLAAAL